MKRYLLQLLHLSLIIAVVFLPTTLAQAQTIPTAAQIRERFNPNATTMGGSTFGGIQFSGVGGAIAGCANVGSSINKGINSISGLFKSLPNASNAPAPTPITSAPNLNTSTLRPSVTAGTSASSANTNAAARAAVGQNQVVPVQNQAVPVTDKKANEELSKANLREQCLNGVAYAVAKGLLQQVTNRTLNWVNTGFGGNPLFVRDIDSFLQTVSDERVALFLDRIPNQNPIFGNAIRSIVTEQVSGIQDGLIDSAMNTPEGRAYQNFQEDFTNGGWAAFLNPQNNAIDAIFNAADDLSGDIARKQGNVVNELQRNQGFLDMKKCAEFAPITSSTVIYCDELPPDGQAGSGCVSRSQAAANANASTQCLRWETVTPGSTIEERVAAVTNTDIRQLEQADQINEILGAFFDQLLSRLFTFGLSSIGDRNNNVWGFGGVGTNTVLSSNGQPLAGSTSAGLLGTTVGGSGYLLADFDISRPQYVRTILQAQYDYLHRMQDAYMALNRVIPTLGALDYCIPGPNPTWRDGLNENADTYFGSLQIPTAKPAGSTGATVGATAGAIGGSFIPGVGTAIGAAVGGLVGGLFDSGGKPHGMVGINISLFDKASGENVLISDTVYHESNRSPEAVFNNIQLRYGEVLDFYEKNYTKDTVKNAFMAADPGNQNFAAGFVEDTFIETGNLPAYNQSINTAGLNAQYVGSEASTREAIRELEAIRSEVNNIVATAKTRYIAEQAAAGTPVSRSCIDEAYVIDTRPIVPVARQESNTVSPFLNQSVEAGDYFYTQL